MRLVEVTGLPGSGKSIVTPIIKKYLKTKGFDIYDKYNLVLSCNEFPLNKSLSSFSLKLFPNKTRKKMLSFINKILDSKRTYMAHYFIENRKFCENIMVNISEAPVQFYKKTWLVLWWLNLVSTYQMALESLEESSVLILDEGFFHKVINFFVHLNFDLEYTKIQAFLKDIPNIDLLILIEAGISNCLGRLENRSLPKVIRGSTTLEVRGYLESSQKAIDYSETILAAKGTKIIKIDNSTFPFLEKHITKQLAEESEWLA